MKKIYELLDVMERRLPYLRIELKDDAKKDRIDVWAITYYDTIPITEYRETAVGEYHIEEIYERLYYNILSHLLFNQITETMKIMNIDVEAINERKRKEEHEEWLKRCNDFDIEVKSKLGMSDSSSS